MCLVLLLWLWVEGKLARLQELFEFGDAAVIGEVYLYGYHSDVFVFECPLVAILGLGLVVAESAREPEVVVYTRARIYKGFPETTCISYTRKTICRFTINNGV